MPVKFVTSGAHFYFCLYSDPMGCARSCNSSFLKYQTKAHFRRPLSSYHSKLRPLSSKEMKMKKSCAIGIKGLTMKKDLVPSRYSLLSKRRSGLILMRLSISLAMPTEKKYLMRIGSPHPTLFFTIVACILYVTLTSYNRFLHSPKIRV